MQLCLRGGGAAGGIVFAQDAGVLGRGAGKRRGSSRPIRIALHTPELASRLIKCGAVVLPAHPVAGPRTNRAAKDVRVPPGANPAVCGERRLRVVGGIRSILPKVTDVLEGAGTIHSLARVGRVGRAIALPHRHLRRIARASIRTHIPGGAKQGRTDKCHGQHADHVETVFHRADASGLSCNPAQE